MLLETIRVSIALFNPSRVLALLTLIFSLVNAETTSCEYKYHLLSLMLNQMKGFLYSLPPDFTYSKNVKCIPSVLVQRSNVPPLRSPRNILNTPLTYVTLGQR